MLEVTIAASTANVSFTGTSGYNYQVMRSTNLTQWTVLGTVLMPSLGVYTNVDNAPPSPAAFYRAAWVP
jgi:hypothetical protein